MALGNRYVKNVPDARLGYVDESMFIDGKIRVQLIVGASNVYCDCLQSTNILYEDLRKDYHWLLDLVC